jgi:tetratricopeptide (TPR) repeat protein
MKKLLFFGLAFLLGSGLQAQEPLKDIKKAARLLATYNLDPSDPGKLDEAIALADASIGDAAVKADPASWQTYGEVHMAALNNDVQAIVLNSAAPIAHPTSAAKSFEGFKMATELAQKSYQTKDAMKALAAGLQNIYYMGSALYQAGDFKNAYGAFKATYDGFALTQKNNEPSNFDPKEHNKTLYYAALCAQQAGMMPEAKSALETLVAKGDAEAEVYEALVGMSQDNDAEVERLLAEARTKYPNDLGLLYSEINHYLQKGEMASLITKLEQAIQMEPNNVSVYVTLGQVYDKLYQDQAGTDPAAAEESFKKALQYYQQGLEKDPKNFDAVYSIGALWYNKAAAYSLELNELANDYSAEGNRKYDAKKKEMDEAFAKAQPFFQQAETINPKDLNTLIALREIYARQENYPKVDEYKAKIEALGGAN